jgi:VanZ family protein
MSIKTLIWVIAEIAIVFILLSLPGSSFHTPSKWFGDFPIDKLVHVCLFGSLSFSFFIHFENTKYRPLKTVRAKALVLIFCILYGIGMEFYQKYFVPSRGFEVNDMLADAIGAILALPLFNWIKNVLANKSSKE